MSALMRLCVSSTIMRIRRRRRRSTKPERTSKLGSAADFDMLVRSGNASHWRHIPSCVFPITLGPNLVSDGVLDAGFVIADGGFPHRSHRHEVQRTTGERANERNHFREPFAHEARP